MDGQTEREFEINLADAQTDWWAFMDVTAFKGRTINLRVDKLPEDSSGLKLIGQSNQIKDAQNLYHEVLRPQFLFSQRAMAGLQRPQPLRFYQGKYHLFFRHKPWRAGMGGTSIGDMPSAAICCIGRNSRRCFTRIL